MAERANSSEMSRNEQPVHRDFESFSKPNNIIKRDNSQTTHVTEVEKPKVMTESTSAIASTNQIVQDHRRMFSH